MSANNEDNTAVMQALAPVIEQFRLVNYMRIAAVALLAYDIWIMFDLEFRYIWRAKWSLPKILYISARYYALFFLALEFSVNTRVGLSLNFCRGYLGFYTCASYIVAGTIVNAVLTLRLYALYGKKKSVLIWLLIVLILDLAAGLGVSIVITVHLQRTVSHAPIGIPLTGCFATAPQTLTLIAWIPRILSSTVFFFMTLYKMFTSLANKRRVALKSIRLSTKFSPLLTCFYRDGAIYYTVITSIIMICTVTVVTLDGPLVLVATPFLNAGYSLAVCRLILNLRRTALGRNASATWAETVSLRANDQANDANDGGIQLEPYQPTRFRGLHVM